jgi:hypothetical protein
MLPGPRVADAIVAAKVSGKEVEGPERESIADGDADYRVG